MWLSAAVLTTLLILPYLCAVDRAEGQAAPDDAIGRKLHPGMKTGEPTSDAELFGALDLTLPGLAKTRDCVAQGDYQGARAELYDYLRGKFRRAQYYSASRPADPEADAAFVRRETIADDLVLRGKVVFRSTGRTYEFDRTKPFDFLDFDPAGREYHEPMQLYAFYDLSEVEYMHFVTEDPRYLDLAKEMVTSYCHWFMGGANGPVAAECGMQASLTPWDNWTVPRRMRALLRFLTFLQKADSGPDLVVDVMKILLEDERLHVSRADRWGGNWRQYMCGDGAAIALALFEFKEAQGWFNNQLGGLLAGASDIMPDGSICDLSPAYTDGYLIWLRDLTDIRKAFGSPLEWSIPADTAARYEKTIDWQLAMRKPDGVAVPFNDTGAAMAPSYYGRLAGELFEYFGRDDLRWFATGGAEGRPPSAASFPPTSTTLCYAGLYAMRSDWTPEALYLAVDFGPSVGHAHPDYGSFVLHAYGADLIDEGGCASYGSEAHAHYSVHPWAHNIIAVDGIGQHPARGRPPWGEPLSNWITNEAYDFAWGSLDLEDEQGNLRGIVHRRALYFAKPDYFLLLDAVEGEAAHELRSKLQLAWDVTAEVRGSAVEARSRRGAALKVVPFDTRPAPTVIVGQQEPFWDGWVSKVQHASNVEPAPAVVFEHRCELPAYYQTLLYPVPPGRRPEVETSRIAAHSGIDDGCLLRVAASGKPYRDAFVISHGGSPVVFDGGKLSLEGRLLHLRYTGDRLTRIAFVRTESISLPVGGEQVRFRFQAPTDGCFDLSGEGTSTGGRLYLDLSNRVPVRAAEISLPGREPIAVEAEVGRPVAIR